MNTEEKIGARELYEQLTNKKLTNTTLSDGNEIEVILDSSINPTRIIITEKAYCPTQGKSTEIRCNRIELS